MNRLKKQSYIFFNCSNSVLQEIKIEKSMLVCDARYVTPLAVGLPLNTDAIITSTVKFDLAGFINSSAFVSEGQFDLEGKLRPR